MNEKTNQNHQNNRKKTVLIVAAVVLVFLASAAYWAADRYLIEHVELEIAVPPVQSTVTVVPTSAAIEEDDPAVSEAVEVETESASASLLTDEAIPAETAAVESSAADEALSESVGANDSAELTVPESELEVVASSESAEAIASADSAAVIPAANLSDEVVKTVLADEAAGKWVYQDDGVTITIERVTRGRGTDTVTYFVADVVLSDATTLLSAFAKNKFGTNIIEKVTTIADNNNAAFAINGDYYGFRSDGILIRNGVIYRNNPARIGLAMYTDGSMRVYDETQTDAETLLAEGVWNTLSFGPALIENGVVRTDYAGTWIDTNFGNRTIERANPRTGIGLIDENHFFFIVADGRSKGYSRGLTLAELANVFAELGCSEAYNIDGGGSSAMYFMGELVNNPLGRDKERGTSDILYIAETEDSQTRLASVASE